MVVTTLLSTLVMALNLHKWLVMLFILEEPHLALETKSSYDLTIDSSGKIGVGTTSPNGFLDVQSTVVQP